MSEMIVKFHQDERGIARSWDEVGELIRCKNCEYGEQDEDGFWFCRSIGCTVGGNDGSGFCADAERRGLRND